MSVSMLINHHSYTSNYTITFSYKKECRLEQNSLSQIFAKAQEQTGFSLDSISKPRIQGNQAEIELTFKHFNKERRSAYSLVKIRQVFQEYLDASLIAGIKRTTLPEDIAPPKKRIKTIEGVLDRTPKFEGALCATLNPAQGLVPPFFKLPCTISNLKKVAISQVSPFFNSDAASFPSLFKDLD